MAPAEGRPKRVGREPILDNTGLILLDGLSAASLLLDADATVVAASAGVARLFGRDLMGCALVGDSLADEAPLVAEVAARCAAARQEGRRSEELVISTDEAGTSQYYWMIATPHPTGKLQGAWVVELTPITQPLTASVALHKVLSQVRHDIRSPLTSIKGAAELLLSGRMGAPAPPQRRLLGIIEEGVQRVNDVLDRTKAQNLDAAQASTAGLSE